MRQPNCLGLWGSNPLATYFISGHLDITPEEFAQHYVPRITQALAEGHNFVVGDARGCDAKTQEFLPACPDRVTVYHMHKTPRNLWGKFQCRGGFRSDLDRDRAMTEASDADIAWVRPGRETSGTAQNLTRRSSSKQNRG